MSYKIDRKTYAQTYGPTAGDRVRLADTELFIEVEKDLTTYGWEKCKSINVRRNYLAFKITSYGGHS